MLPDLPRLHLLQPAGGPATPARVEAQPAALRSTLAFIGHYLRSRPIQFVGLFFVVVGAAGCGVGVQYGMKLMIDAMAAPTSRSLAVETALAVFIGLVGLEAVLWRVSGWLGSRATIAVGVDIKLDLFRHLAGHSMRFFQERLSGSLGHRVTSTAGAFGSIINKLVWEIAPPCVSFVGALALFAALDMTMTAALAGLVALTTTGLVAFGLRGRRHHRAYARRSSQSGGELMDVINNIAAVKAFSARERERARLADAFGEEAQAHSRSWMFSEKIRAVNDAALVVMAAATLLWAAHLWQIGKITPGDVVLVSALTFRLLHGSRDLAMSLIDMGQQYTFIGETLRIVGEPHALVDPAASRAPAASGAITFEKVSFGYRSETPILRNLNLRISAGQKVGLVGASGAGKSTLTQLVQRLYDVDSGRILVDGQPVQAFTQDELRARVAVVPQEVSLFHRSVMENIRFGRPDALDEDVFAAVRAAHCEAFIAELPEGYDTVVGDRGAKLSGGQRQRIGIARAFLKDAPILILDEATSALDAESEAAVQEALGELMEGRTVLAVAHRLVTLSDMDRILVLADGEVVEDGSPFDLQHRGGAFAHLWRMQTSPRMITRPRPPLKAVG